MISTEEQSRIDRILSEANGKPPKRIYSDDAIWLIVLIDRLLKMLKEKK